MRVPQSHIEWNIITFFLWHTSAAPAVLIRSVCTVDAVTLSMKFPLEHYMRTDVQMCYFLDQPYARQRTCGAPSDFILCLVFFLAWIWFYFRSCTISFSLRNNTYLMSVMAFCTKTKKKKYDDKSTVHLYLLCNNTNYLHYYSRMNYYYVII